jgi:hypothetical protein
MQSLQAHTAYKHPQPDSPAAAEIRFSSRSRRPFRHLPDKWSEVRENEMHLKILLVYSKAKRSMPSNHLVDPFRRLERPHDRRLAFEKLLTHRAKRPSAAPTTSQSTHGSQGHTHIQSKNVVHALVDLGQR